MRRLAIVVTLVCAASTSSDADDDDYATSYIHDEAAVGATSATAAVPRAGFASDYLAGAVAVTPAWFLRGGATYTRDEATAAPAGSTFGDQGGNILAFSLGATYQPSERWLFALEADASPKSTTLASTTITVTDSITNRDLDLDAQLRSTASSTGAAALARWHSSGDGAWTSELGLDASFQRLETSQGLTAFATPAGATVTAAQVKADCGAHPEKCPKSFLAALGNEAVTLPIVRVAASAVETYAKDTDLGLTAAYFLYGEDPTTAGYFTVSSLGRARTSFGGGVALEPVDFAVELDVTHRFGGFELEGTFQYARYVEQDGYDLATSLQGKYRFTAQLAALLRLAGQADRDESDQPVRITSATLGARYTF